MLIAHFYDCDKIYYIGAVYSSCRDERRVNRIEPTRVACWIRPATPRCRTVGTTQNSVWCVVRPKYPTPFILAGNWIWSVRWTICTQRFSWYVGWPGLHAFSVHWNALDPSARDSSIAALVRHEMLNPNWAISHLMKEQAESLECPSNASSEIVKAGRACKILKAYSWIWWPVGAIGVARHCLQTTAIVSRRCAGRKRRGWYLILKLSFFGLK
jgi:hypothetical protein